MNRKKFRFLFGEIDEKSTQSTKESCYNKNNPAIVYSSIFHNFAAFFLRIQSKKHLTGDISLLNHQIEKERHFHEHSALRERASL